jgi:hypothetical protein
MSHAALPIGSVPDEIKRVRREVSPFLEHFSRFGFAAKGVVYVIIGLLAALAPIGMSSGPTGQGGAARTILHQPLGWVMLGVIALGTFAFGLFQLMRAIENADNQPNDFKGIFLRIGNGFNALLQFGLALAAVGMIVGWQPPGSGNDDANARSWTAWVMSFPFGRWVVAVIGVSMLIYGLCQIICALRGKLDERLRWTGASDATRKWLRGISCAGVAGRGAVLGLLGVFLISAAWHFNANEAHALGGALATLARQAYGPALLCTAALGLIAYGVYDFVLARYRHIDV